MRRLVEEAVAGRNLDVLDDVAGADFAEVAKRWVRPFESAFPDFEMEIVELIAEGEKVVAHFKCSGTHRGDWLGVPATERRFEGVDEIYIFQVRDGKLVAALGSRTTSPGCASSGSGSRSIERIRSRAVR